MTLVNVYCPEMEDAYFIQNCMSYVMIGGDFYVVMDPVLDGSSTKVSA